LATSLYRVVDENVLIVTNLAVLDNIDNISKYAVYKIGTGNDVNFYYQSSDVLGHVDPAVLCPSHGCYVCIMHCLYTLYT